MAEQLEERQGEGTQMGGLLHGWNIYTSSWGFYKPPELSGAGGELFVSFAQPN